LTEIIEQDGIQGILHPPTGAPNSTGVVLTHGAGANCRSVLLTVVAEQLADLGYYVLRCDLAFRQRRGTGPPHPNKAEEDRYSLVQAAAFLRKRTPTRVILGGHSYGGRQATILASENRTIAEYLLLLSYPLHPPEKPAQLRTAHFPKLKVPSTFVHGSVDPFGSLEEMKSALELIPAQTKLSIVNRAGHDLLKGRFNLSEVAGALE
jgi:predicted alpha/beta-hydrolase family hydrolase